jgi:hypothetical protein
MPLEKPRRENQPRRDSFIELAGKFLSLQQQYFSARNTQNLSRKICQQSTLISEPNSFEKRVSLLYGLYSPVQSTKQQTLPRKMCPNLCCTVLFCTDKLQQQMHPKNYLEICATLS